MRPRPPLLPLAIALALLPLGACGPPRCPPVPVKPPIQATSLPWTSGGKPSVEVEARLRHGARAARHRLSPIRPLARGRGRRGFLSRVPVRVGGAEAGPLGFGLLLAPALDMAAVLGGDVLHQLPLGLDARARTATLSPAFAPPSPTSAPVELLGDGPLPRRPPGVRPRGAARAPRGRAPRRPAPAPDPRHRGRRYLRPHPGGGGARSAPPAQPREGGHRLRGPAARHRHPGARPRRRWRDGREQPRPHQPRGGQRAGPAARALRRPALRGRKRLPGAAGRLSRLELPSGVPGGPLGGRVRRARAATGAGALRLAESLAAGIHRPRHLHGAVGGSGGRAESRTSCRSRRREKRACNRGTSSSPWTPHRWRARRRPTRRLATRWRWY